MVLKGVAASKLQKIRLEGRPERTLFVSFKKLTKRDKVEGILKKAHPDIERVFSTRREKLSKFAYVLCKATAERNAVRDAINKMRSEDLGRIYARPPKPRKEEKAKSPMSSDKRVVDRCTLLLEWIPAELETEEIEKAFSEAIKVDRFNKRRCYVHFGKPKDAMKAKIRFSTEEIAGHKLNVKFNKIKETSGGATSSPKTDDDDGVDQQSESE